MRFCAAAIALVLIGGCKAGNGGGSQVVADGGSGGATAPATGGSGGEIVCDEGTACDNACVDTSSDPSNCGGCGRTCVVPNADAMCVAGSCALDTCALGFADCDSDMNNGCELAVDCDTGSACATSCSTTGLLNCTNPCAPTCDLPVEACNLLDDDCDTLCDNGAIPDCRVGVHRAFGPNGHFYTTDPAEPAARGYDTEFTDYFFLYAADVADLRPLFRCVKGSGKTWLTTDTACEGAGGVEVTVGFIAAQQDCASIPLYRLVNGPEGEHFYTISAGERQNAIDNLGFTDEGITGYVWAEP